MTRSERFSYLVCATLILSTHSAWAFWPFDSTPKEETPPATTAVADPDPASTSAPNDPPSTPPVRCALMGDYAVADWLNTINLGSFLDFSSKYVLDHDQCFVFFNSCQDASFWVEPYGFYSHYRSSLKHGHKMDFTLATYGSDIGAKFSLSDSFNLGGGVGYFHSNLNDKKDHKKAEINGIYFGPALEYLFHEGSVQFTAFGVKNYYDGPDAASDGSWDLNLRLEADYNYIPPSDFCIADFMLHPFGRIDYLNVFEESPDRHSSFFYSKLGARFDKVAYCSQALILTANLDLSWVNMSPLSGDSVRCEDQNLNVKPNSKNQLGIGFELVGMHKNGVLIGLEYDAALGANAPMQTGRVRIEWNW